MPAVGLFAMFGHRLAGDVPTLRSMPQLGAGLSPNTESEMPLC